MEDVGRCNDDTASKYIIEITKGDYVTRSKQSKLTDERDEVSGRFKRCLASQMNLFRARHVKFLSRLYLSKCTFTYPQRLHLGYLCWNLQCMSLNFQKCFLYLPVYLNEH